MRICKICGVYLIDENKIFAKYIALSTFAYTLIHLDQLVCLNFLHNHCIALWSKSVIPLCQAIPTPISRPLKLNTQTCARHWWIAAHCRVEQSNDWGLRRGQWCPWGDDGHLLTHSPPLHYSTAPHILLFTQYHRPLQTHSVQDLSWTTEGPGPIQATADIRPLG